MEFKRLIKLWGSQNWGSTQEGLDSFKSQLTLSGPNKLDLSFQQVCQWSYNCGEVLAKAPIVAYHTEKPHQFLLGGRNRKMLDSLNFGLNWTHLPLTNHLPQVSDSGFGKFTFN